MRKIIAALAVGVFIGYASMQVGATIPTIPMSTPAEVIAQVNAYLGNIVTLSANTGELAFNTSQSWAVNSNVATTMTSLGPQGSHTTVQEWLVVVHGTTARYIPTY